MPKRPWFGTKEQAQELIAAAERRLAMVLANSTVKVDVEIKQTNTTYGVPSPLLTGKLHTTAKELRADGRSIDVSGTMVAQIAITWDKDGIALFATSTDADWVDITVLELSEEIRDSQRRWIFMQSRLVRLLACLVGVLDAAGLGLLVAFSLGKISEAGPNLAAGIATALIAAIAFSAASLRLPLFAITRDNSQGAYLALVKFLVVSLAFGVALQILINLAT